MKKLLLIVSSIGCLTLLGCYDCANIPSYIDWSKYKDCKDVIIGSASPAPVLDATIKQ